jgi:hypothetical protein
MVTLQYLIKTPLYKDLNVTIHHQWENLFTLHMDLKSQILNYIGASYNISILIVKKILYTNRLMIHNCLDIPKMMDYDNTIYSITLSQNFHLLGLFKNKHLEELDFPTLFLWATLTSFKSFFHINK